MKLSAILSLMRQRKRVMINKGDNTQWIGDGFASYPVYSFPYFCAESIQALLGVNFDAWSKYTYDYIDKMPFSEDDSTADEILLSELEIKISYKGCDMIPLTDGASIYYIETKYLKPFNDFDPIFYYRSDTKIIAVKEGMILRGLIMPHYFAEVSRKSLLEELRKAHFMTEGMMVLSNNMEQENEINEIFGCKKTLREE